MELLVFWITIQALLPEHPSNGETAYIYASSIWDGSVQALFGVWAKIHVQDAKITKLLADKGFELVSWDAEKMQLKYVKKEV